MPFRSWAVGSVIGSGSEMEVESRRSCPVMCESRSAPSETLRLKGPAWSSEEANAIIPHREQTP